VIRVLGLLNNKGKVNRNALIALTSLARIVSGAGSLVELGLETDGALVKLMSNISSSWDAVRKMVLHHFLEDLMTHVTKATMPK